MVSAIPGDWKKNELANSRKGLIGLYEVVSSFEVYAADDWLRAPRRAMCVPPGKSKGNACKDQRFSKSPETISRKPASLEIVSDQGSETTNKLALYASEPPLPASVRELADPCRCIAWIQGAKYFAEASNHRLYSLVRLATTHVKLA